MIFPVMSVGLLNFPEIFIEFCYVLLVLLYPPLAVILKDLYGSFASLLIGSGQTFTLAPTSPGTCRRASTKGNPCSNSPTPCTVQGVVAVAC